MKKIALFLENFLQLWCVIISVSGTLFTLLAMALCAAPGDYLMALIVGLCLACLFIGAYLGPKFVANRLIRRLTTKTIYHHMPDGSILVEERRI